MKTNFLKELRENRPLQKALLIGLFLILFVWAVIVLIFRFRPEELVGPFPLDSGPTAPGTPLPNVAGIVVHTATSTPIVRSTFTPRTDVPPTATRTRLSSSSATGSLTVTPAVRPTFTARPTNTLRPGSTSTPRPTNTARPRPSNTSAPPSTPIITIPTIVIPLPTNIIPTIVIQLPTIVIPTIDLPFP